MYKKKIDLGIYQGKRHNLGYPVRGQRTLSNGKTQKKNYINFVFIMLQNYLLMLSLKIKGKVKIQKN